MKKFKFIVFEKANTSNRKETIFEDETGSVFDATQDLCRKLNAEYPTFHHYCELMDLPNNEGIKDKESCFVLSIDNSPTLVLSTIDQLNERNYAKCLALRGWDMMEESEAVVNSDKVFVNSFLGVNNVFSQYALKRRTYCGHTLLVKIHKVPKIVFDIVG